MAIKAYMLILAAVLPNPAASACQGNTCKVGVPQDEVSLIQMKTEGHTPAVPPGSFASHPNVDLDNGKDAMAEEVEAGKHELREYVEELKGDKAAHAMNSTMGRCDDNWDTSIRENDDLMAFLDYGCLVPQDPNRMDHTEKAELNNCGRYNSASEKQGSFAFTQKAMGTEETGGICHSKAYVVKCHHGAIPSKCRKLRLFRAFSDPPAWDTDCPQWGGFWAAGDPRDMRPKDYRYNYAICKKWNPRMNAVAIGYLNDNACGAVVLIGNGEAVREGVCDRHGDETYPYSPYLQVVMCRRPHRCRNFPMDVEERDY